MVLYSPVTSLNGAKLLLNKGPPRKVTIEDVSDAQATPTILTPHALPMFRDLDPGRGTKRKREKERMDPKKLRWGIYVFIFVTTVIAGILNPSILDLISVVGGVFITFLVCIVPMLLFRYAKDYQRYANKPETWFVFVLGVVIMGVAIWQMFAG